MTLLPPGCDARVQVIGPSYLDEIIEVDGPLCHERWVREALPERAGPVRIDYSRTEAEREPLDEPGVFLQVDSPGGDSIRVTEPGTSGGRRLLVEEERLFDAASLGLSDDPRVPPLLTEVPLCGRRLQLGGMGAGYALALGGRLVLPLGAAAGQPDVDALKMCEMMEGCGISCDPVWVSGADTDVTTLLWSSAGDKLPVGRRSACYAVTAEALLERAVPADLNIITSLPSATARSVAKDLTGWKLLTPSLRNLREGGVEQVCAAVDAVSMNSTEWGALADPEQVRRCCPLVLVTRGEEGAAVAFRDKAGRMCWTEVPAAELEEGVVDANHAGEAFTAGFLGALLGQMSVAELRRGEYSEGILREAAWQGSLSAALELTKREMRFPDRAEVLELRGRMALTGR